MKFILPDKVYNIMVWVAQYLIPALGTFYFALSGIWKFPYGEQVLGTLAALDTFLGALLGISLTNWSKKEAAKSEVVEDE